MKKEKIPELLSKFKSRGFLTEPISQEIFKAYGVNVPPSCLVQKAEEGIKFAEEIGWPVVLKVVSPQIIHKSEAGGVIVNLENPEELTQGIEKIRKNVEEYKPGGKIEGIYVQKMISSPREVIVGASKDKQFGPIIMFGLGGIFVEVLEDVVFRVAPIDKKEAEFMVGEIDCFSILEGVRGEEPIDFESLYSTISKISYIIYENQEIKELDANPISVSSSTVCTLDARIILE